VSKTPIFAEEAAVLLGENGIRFLKDSLSGDRRFRFQLQEAGLSVLGVGQAARSTPWYIHDVDRNARPVRALNLILDWTGRHSERSPSMKVKQAMHKGVQWVGPGASVVELAKLMREHDIGAIPIGENDRLVGMVTDRDIVCRCIAAGLDVNTATAGDVMTKAWCSASISRNSMMPRA
jgi:hypothetical protein